MINPSELIEVIIGNSVNDSIWNMLKNGITITIEIIKEKLILKENISLPENCETEIVKILNNIPKEVKTDEKSFRKYLQESIEFKNIFDTNSKFTNENKNFYNNSQDNSKKLFGNSQDHSKKYDFHGNVGTLNISDDEGKKK